MFPRATDPYAPEGGKLFVTNYKNGWRPFRFYDVYKHKRNWSNKVNYDTSSVFNISALLVAYTFIHESIPFVQAAIHIAMMTEGKTF